MCCDVHAKQQVEKIRPLNDILKKICDDDENVKKSPGLKTLRILTKEVTKKLSETSKAAPSTETKILEFLDAKSPRDKIEAICEALKNEKDGRICGFLADLFIENNVGAQCLTIVNACRLYLRLYNLSDMVSSDGTEIL